MEKQTRAVKMSNRCGIELNLILNDDEIKQYENNGFVVIEELNKDILRLKY